MHHHVCAFGGKSSADRRADAARSARDHDYFSLESSFHGLLESAPEIVGADVRRLKNVPPLLKSEPSYVGSYIGLVAKTGFGS
jgi:hypothetical protein